MSVYGKKANLATPGFESQISLISPDYSDISIICMTINNLRNQYLSVYSVIQRPTNSAAEPSESSAASPIGNSAASPLGNSAASPAGSSSSVS